MDDQEYLTKLTSSTIENIEKSRKDGTDLPDLSGASDEAYKAVMSVVKGRVYVDDPSEAPEGVEVQEGERGGTYYVDGGGDESASGGGGTEQPDAATATEPEAPDEPDLDVVADLEYGDEVVLDLGDGPTKYPVESRPRPEMTDGDLQFGVSTADGQEWVRPEDEEFVSADPDAVGGDVGDTPFEEVDVEPGHYSDMSVDSEAFEPLRYSPDTLSEGELVATEQPTGGVTVYEVDEVGHSHARAVDDEGNAWSIRSTDVEEGRVHIPQDRVSVDGDESGSETPPGPGEDPEGYAQDREFDWPEEGYSHVDPWDSDDYQPDPGDVIVDDGEEKVIESIGRFEGEYGDFSGVRFADGSVERQENLRTYIHDGDIEVFEHR